MKRAAFVKTALRIVELSDPPKRTGSQALRGAQVLGRSDELFSVLLCHTNGSRRYQSTLVDQGPSPAGAFTLLDQVAS